MGFKIKYNFVDEAEFHTCYVTYDQYLNFKELPSIDTCIAIKEKNEENYKTYQKEMQEAINLATKNDTSHIRKLSECI